jgi:HlyD family secretion protein
MKRLRPLPFLLLAAGAAIALALALPRLDREDLLTGYVEGEPLYLASPVAGAVRTMHVRRGDVVAAGQPLFLIDPRQLAAQRDQAEAEVAAAAAQAADARKGQRPSELAALDAEAAAAEARARDAAADLRRIRPLVQRGIYAPARLDDARAANEAAQAAAAAARRRRETAALGAREDQIRAAEARAAEAGANLTAAQARLAELAPSAPAAGRIEEVFFQAGEWAPANRPVLSLLPDDRIRLRFFVPEPTLSAYRPGAQVRFSCDGCAKGLTARITYISPRAEFTPPVIYSREARDHLVYRVEAAPSARLNPGQPVDVVPLRAR